MIDSMVDSLIGSASQKRVHSKSQKRDRSKSQNWEYYRFWNYPKIGYITALNYNAGTYPLDRLVKEAREEHEEALKQYEVSSLVRDSSEKALKDKLKDAGKKGDEDKQNQIANQLLELQEADSGAPILKRYKTNDASPEALAELEKHNPNGILVCRDELVGLLSSLDKNDSDSGRAFYLEGWNGNKPY